MVSAFTMDRRATKDLHERETEETERLVRPSPKVKPPRHDRRRETVEPEKDPDLDTTDKDLSRNYKDIGGSVGATIVTAKDLPTQQPAPKLQSAPKPAKSRKVKVRRKQDGWVGFVTEDTIKETPGAYEELRGKDEKPAPKKVKSPEPAAAVPASPAAKPGTPKAQLEGMAKKDPQFAAFLKNFTDPKSEPYALAVGNPNLPASSFFKKWKLPPEVKTIGDLQKVMLGIESEPAAEPDDEIELQDNDLEEIEPGPHKAAPPPIPKGKVQPAGKAAPQPQEPQEFKYQAPTKGVEDKYDRAARDEMQGLMEKNPALAAAFKDVTKPKSQVAKDIQANPEHPVSMYFQDVLKGVQLPEDVQTLGDLQRVLSLPKSGRPKQPKAPLSHGHQPKPGLQRPALKKVPGQPTRAVTDHDRLTARNLIVNTFPANVAADLTGLQPELHPDEVSALVKQYNTAKLIPLSPNKIDQFRERARKFYTLDPSKAEPPQTVTNEAGKKVPLDTLSVKDQETAIRQHQIKTVAMSLAAKHALSDALIKKTGAPKQLAETLSDFMLERPVTKTEAQKNRGAKQAEQLFNETLQAPAKNAPKLSDKQIAKILNTTTDPGARKIAVSYFQALDYQEARRSFLDPSSGSSGISEMMPAKDIAKNLTAAMAFLRNRARRYPDDGAVDASRVFRDRVMKQLSKLTPEKMEPIQAAIDEADNDQYDRDLKTYGKEFWQYQKHLERAQKELAKAKAKYKKGDKPIPTSPEKWLEEQGIREPRAPHEPPRYAEQRKHPSALKDDAKDMWDDFDLRTASDSAFSTYPPACAMDRKAVYWGTNPNEAHVEYPDSEQPLARDLGEADYSRILESAKVWLKSPVLSEDIDGILKDTQHRAALDLAIRTEGYGAVLHPSIYETLLARLSGHGSVTATRNNHMAHNKVELETAKADALLARLDRMASTIIEKHEQWGMPQKLAKVIVNEIDKTADELETAVYGEESLQRRQASVLGFDKAAEVLEKDQDEDYMSTFSNPMKPVQTNADEKYMSAYGDDQSSAVRHGKSTSGRPLAK